MPAERQMGAFLRDMPKSTGARGVGPNAVAEKDRINGLTTLADIGVTKDQSSRAQKLAAIPEHEFQERVAVAKASGGKLSTANVRHTTRRPQEACAVVPRLGARLVTASAFP